MKHKNQINSEFAKIALTKTSAKFEDLSYEAQKEYLKQHPATKKKITKSPGDSGEPLSALKEDIKSKREQLKTPLQNDMTELKDALKEAFKGMTKEDEFPMYGNKYEQIKELGTNVCESLENDLDIKQGKIRFLMKQSKFNPKDDSFEMAMLYGPDDAEFGDVVAFHMNDKGEFTNKWNEPVDKDKLKTLFNETDDADDEYLEEAFDDDDDIIFNDDDENTEPFSTIEEVVDAAVDKADKWLPEFDEDLMEALSDEDSQKSFIENDIDDFFEKYSEHLEPDMISENRDAIVAGIAKQIFE